MYTNSTQFNFLLVITTPQPEKILEAAEARGVEAKEIGIVTQNPGIRIANRGAAGDG